jgi:YtkA-like
MRSAVFFTVVLAALALAAEASAGCFATAGLTAPPATVGPGDTWNALITVKQHGTRPIPDAKPTLTIQGENDATKTFSAKPTDTVGVYAASVVFPTSGEWSYVVNDGFVSQEQGQTWDCSTTHTFAAVTIGGTGSSGPAAGDPAAAPSVEPASAPDDGGLASLAVVLIVAAAVALVAAAGVALARSSARRHARA